MILVGIKRDTGNKKAIESLYGMPFKKYHYSVQRRAGFSCLDLDATTVNAEKQPGRYASIPPQNTHLFDDTPRSPRGVKTSPSYSIFAEKPEISR